MDAEDFADIYFEIANAIGAENAVKIHSLFRGQQIQFPQKLYKKEYIYSYIKRIITVRTSVNCLRNLDIQIGASGRLSIPDERYKKLMVQFFNLLRPIYSY